MDLGNVAIIGLGRSTTAAARFCLAALRGGLCGATASSMRIYGGAGTEAARKAAAEFVEAGIEAVFDCEDVEGSYDIAIASPGIPEGSAFLQSAKAHACEVVYEPELAFRASPERWIGVTGTNGKTTTTTLATALMEAAGHAAHACGNIGMPCIEAVALREPGDWMVAELSSFHLTSMSTFSPDAAILLNLTPDHIEWHGSLEAYYAAKLRIFANQRPEQVAVIDCTADITRKAAADLAAAGHSVVAIGGPLGLSDRYHPLGVGALVPAGPDAPQARHGAAYLDGGSLVVELEGARHVLSRIDELAIRGDHNMQNALAASAAAIACGADDASVSRGLRAYEPIEHRIEPCGEAGGVRFFNDSKATNTDAAAKALTAFPGESVIMLLGGHDKGTDLTGLVADCLASCKAVVCYGEAGGRFRQAFDEALALAAGPEVPEVLSAANMAAAFEAAVAHAKSGDVVLLSPACSSFDEFGSYEERGRAFKELVSGLVR